MPSLPPELGCPLPECTPHAVSVSLPTWRDNVDYEEGDERVISRLTSGYPRFVLPEAVRKLAAVCARRLGRPKESCLPFPSRRVAQRCRDFLAARVRTAPRVVEFAIAPPGPRSLRDAAPDRGCGGGERAAADADPDADPRARLSGRVAVHAVFFAGEDSGAAKEFWQHAGEGASSRFAEHCLRVFAAREEGRAERGAHGDREAKLPAREERPAAGRASTAGPLEGPGNAAGCGRGRYRCQGGGGGPRAFGLRRQEPAAAAPNAAAGGEEEDGGPEIEVFLGERYGRNVDVAAAAGAKLTLRRRIASALRGDRSDGRDGGVSNAVAPRVSEKDVFLFPSGMSAIYNIHRLLLKTRGERASVQFGFPYLDTLKVLEKFGPGCVFFGHGDEADMERLETALADRGERDPVLAVFCEFPSNPLLKSPDLRRLRALADRHDFVLVVDETIGNFVNVAVLQYADVTVTSLTKVFSGDSDVMGGSAVLNPDGKHYDALRKAMDEDYEDNVWGMDAVVLERNSRRFRERVRQIDANAEAVCDYLAGHPKVRKVYYPKFVTPDAYASCRRRPAERGCGGGGDSARPGYGGLFSVVLAGGDDEEASSAAARFFDALAVRKGPSLGTTFTLACPYTILAHYGQFDWAAGFGVASHLVRVSVGTEPVEELLRAFRVALEAA